MRIKLVADDERERASARAVLESLSAEVVELSSGGAVLDRTEADLSMVLFTGDDANGLVWLEAQAALSPHPPLFALLSDRSAPTIRRVLHAGADEVLFLPLDASQVDCALLKFNERRRQQAEGPDECLICSVTSLAGGVGVTTLSANLALAMHYVFDQRAAVVDLDLQSGGAGLYLHLEPETTIMSLVENADKLDSLKLEAALTRHGSGIYLLAAPGRIDDCDSVTDSAVTAVLKLMRQLFDFVVVDCGQRIDENAAAAWESSDQLLYIIDPSLAGARTVGRFLDLFGTMGLSALQPRLVVNRWGRSPAIALARIEQLAGIPVFARVPADGTTLERLGLQMQDLWQAAAGSTLARSTEQLARLLNAREAAPARHGNSLFGRTLNALGLSA